MDAPLWTETHAPALAELPQEGVREYLMRATDEPINLALYGPKGAGKTAAVRALARGAHDSENDLVEINVADFFGMTKKEISEDPRFSSFITPKRRRETSKAGLINHVLKESASYPPVSGEYKTILLDNAEAIREDFQQALRRVMERHHEAAQFVITTRQPSALIAPIVSRCFPVPMRAPTSNEIVSVLEKTVEREGIEFDPDGLEYVAGYAEGDLRKAILGAQTTAEAEGTISMESAYEALGAVGADDRIEDMLVAAENGKFTDARKLLDELLIDEGYDGGEVLSDFLTVSRSRYNGEQLATVHERAGEIDLDLTEGTSDRIQLGQLLAELGAD